MALMQIAVLKKHGGCDMLDLEDIMDQVRCLQTFHDGHPTSWCVPESACSYASPSLSLMAVISCTQARLPQQGKVLAMLLARQVDKNSDGKIDYEEFSQMMYANITVNNGEHWKCHAAALC